MVCAFMAACGFASIFRHSIDLQAPGSKLSMFFQSDFLCDGEGQRFIFIRSFFMNEMPFHLTLIGGLVMHCLLTGL